MPRKLTAAFFGRTELSSTTNRRAATGLDEDAIAAVQAGVRHRLLRTIVRGTACLRADGGAAQNA